MKLTNEKIDFHQLVENSLNSIWLVGEDRTILYCNKAGLELLNYQSMEDVINQSIYLFLPKKLHALCNSGLTRVMKYKDVIDRLDITILKNHGEIADVELIAVPYYSGDKVFAQVIIQDITDKKMAIKRLNDKEKLASLGQIAAGIVHEVKNPLTAVKGFLQLIKESQNHPYLDTMESELEKAFDTLQKLLQVSKPDLQDEPLVRISLCSKLNMVLLLFQEKMYSVQVELDLRDADRIIIGKKNLFLKAFFNLIKNAFEAIKDQGKIKIEHYYENSMVHVRISDTGEGIPADKIKMLGTPFFSSKNDGTGLGLTQVYTTIHEHGGIINVSSKQGVGTTIHIELPAKQV